MERAFGVLKAKFLSLKHPIRFHHQDDIFYVVSAVIAMHNMMVQYRVEHEGVVESASFYAVSNLEDAEGGIDDNGVDESNERDAVGCLNYDPTNQSDYNAKYAMVQKRWSELYDAKEAKRLQQAVINQLYFDRFGEEGLADANCMDDNYNPLII